MKPHLRYDSVNDWMIGENIPEDFLAIEDIGERTRYCDQYNELRQHLFSVHILGLSGEEQAQFEEGTHPSQSHSFAERAKPIAGELEQEMRKLGHKCNIDLGWYHMDRIVFTCDLVIAPRNPDGLPLFFRGFEIKYNWP